MADKPVTEQTAVADPITQVVAVLKERFPEAVQADERKGFSGIVVDPRSLVDVATVVRDEMGFDYLSSATAVDYLGKGDYFEMVYTPIAIGRAPSAGHKAAPRATRRLCPR
jgi:NADH:ubiquinone oxidoreductase subunit C